MSHFQGVAYKIMEFRSDLSCDIERNDTPNEDGEAPNLSPLTLARIVKLQDLLGPYEELIRAVDKLYSSDHSEASFNAIFDEQIGELRGKVSQE